MRGLGSLFTLILLAALPIVLAYLWLVIRKYQFNIIWFLCSLLAGIISVLIAWFIQMLIPAITAETMAGLLIKIIVQTTVPEELSRLLAAFLLIALSKRWKRLNPIEKKSDGAAAGLIMGLGFVLFETAAYSISNIQITLLRAVTSAPLHAACGIRTGIGAVSFMNRKTASGIWNMVLAILIHTAYNFIILSPRTPLIFLILVVAVSTISSLMYIKAE